MKLLRIASMTAASLALAASLLSSQAQDSHAGKLTGHAADGKQDFPRYCNGCHGVRGDGNGTFAPYLEPRPRDFTAAIYKCRSTPSGSLPTDQDLYDTMVRGIVTTAMPPWAALTPQTRIDIVAYLKTFSSRYAHEAPGIPVVIGTEAEISIEGLKRGAALYTGLGCAKCHGAQGHGDGPEAATLLDVKHRILTPYDFTLTNRFKCGASSADLYRVFMTGLDGTSMPSYVDKLDPSQAWDLVHYVRTLQVTHKSPENRILHAAGGTINLSQPGSQPQP